MPPASVIAECLDDNAVAELVDGKLDGAALANAEAHLVRCQACRALVAHAAGPLAESGVAMGLASTQRSDPTDREDVPLARGARVGRYEVIEWLGAGAMGTVYAAQDPALERKIALKLIRAQVAGPDLEARLLREAKAMARLSHPEVIAVYDAGRHDDRLFIAMELVDGGTLREWLRAAPRTRQEILAVYLRAGRGLAQAHAAGIVHRDFKPDNVLVGADGRVRVTDFGLARTVRSDEPLGVTTDDGARTERDAQALDASLTRTGTLVGTPVYMAPEQLAGRAADERSDVYSFCIALYEALHGERPFAGKTMKELVAAKAAGNVRPPPAKPNIPGRLRRALLAGLSVHPADRPASMSALLDTLARAARAPRRPFVFAAALVAVVAGAGTVVVKPWARSPSRAGAAASASASASPAGAGACTTHRACTESHGGAPYLCRASDRTCVPIASEDCTPKYEANDLVADDTVWLGAMFPLTGPAAAAYGTMNVEGTELARKELAQATRALDGTHASLRVRRIALVACDDSVDPMRAARHLVDDVGVPAILGFGSGQKLVDVAGSFLIGRGIVSIASLSSSPFLTRVPQPADLPHMVWRTTFSLDDVASATAVVIHDVLEPRQNRKSHATRIALVREDTAATSSFADVFYKQLAFNGKPALENGRDYEEITFAAGAPIEASTTRAADRVVEAAPGIVVLLGAPSATVALVGAVEARWKPGAPRPTYVVANDSLEDFASYLGTSIDRRRRLFAIESLSSSTVNARFVFRYNDVHDEHVTQFINPGVSYDAFYLLAYAVYALGKEPVDGPALARAFEHLVPPGRPIEVGPTQVFDALTVLAAGGRIDLQGTQSTLDFDLATGEAPSDFALLCARVDGDGGANGEDVESGVVGRARARRIEGTMRCP